MRYHHLTKYLLFSGTNKYSGFYFEIILCIFGKLYSYSYVIIDNFAKGFVSTSISFLPTEQNGSLSLLMPRGWEGIGS